jgi:hypothetical protein
MRHMLCLLPLLLVVLLVGAAPLLAQSTVTEDNLLRLIGSKAPEGLIIKVVNSATTVEVDTSIENIPRLMEKGVTGPVLTALVERKEKLSNSSPVTPVPAVAPVNGEAPADTGVFVETASGLTPLPLETVASRKSPGAFQAMKMGASLGFSRMKLSSSLSGVKSSAQLSGTISLVVRCINGISADDYKLIVLEPNKKSGSREFITGSAGMMSSSSGSNTVPLTFEKIGPNTYKTALTLKGGEYGFLVFGNSKLYTFGVY